MLKKETARERQVRALTQFVNKLAVPLRRELIVHDMFV